MHGRRVLKSDGTNSKEFYGAPLNSHPQVRESLCRFASPVHASSPNYDLNTQPPGVEEQGVILCTYRWLNACMYDVCIYKI